MKSCRTEQFSVQHLHNVHPKHRTDIVICNSAQSIHNYYLCALEGGGHKDIGFHIVCLFIYLFIYLSVCHSSSGQSFPRILLILYQKGTHGTRKNPIVLWPCGSRSKGLTIAKCVFASIWMKDYLENVWLDSIISFSGWRVLKNVPMVNAWIHSETCREAAAAAWNLLFPKFNE